MINLTEEELKTILAKAFDEGWKSYYELKESVVESLSKEIISEKNQKKPESEGLYSSFSQQQAMERGRRYEQQIRARGVSYDNVVAGPNSWVSDPAFVASYFDQSVRSSESVTTIRNAWPTIEYDAAAAAATSRSAAYLYRATTPQPELEPELGFNSNEQENL